MSALVIDSSAALSWCFEDEASPGSDVLFEQVRDHGAVVPELWHLEVANVLLQAEKRGRITVADVAMRLALIAELPITTDNETTARAWREILPAARAEGLTTYNAAYLELAIRCGLPLMSKDAALIAAAGRSRRRDCRLTSDRVGQRTGAAVSADARDGWEEVTC